MSQEVINYPFPADIADNTKLYQQGANDEFTEGHPNVDNNYIQYSQIIFWRGFGLYKLTYPKYYQNILFSKTLNVFFFLRFFPPGVAKIIFKSECDQFKQLWHSRIINKDNDHNVTYSLFKLSHGKEMYTEILPEHLKKRYFNSE